MQLKTSRDRPNSAPYLRLKNSKRTSICQVLVSWGPFYENFFGNKVSQCRNKLKGRTFWGFSPSILSQNIKKLKGENFLFSEKNLTVPKKTERWNPLGFSNIHSVANSKKIKGGILWGKTFFRKKSLTMPKKTERALRLNEAIWCNNFL